MNDHVDPVGDPMDTGTPGEGHDPVLAAAGERLREGSRPVSATTVEVRVLRRRTRRMGMVTGAAVCVVALLTGLLVRQGGSTGDSQRAGARRGRPSPAEVDRLLASLPARPVDPTRVKLVGTVSTFPGCDALIGDLRRVGAAHVGSQGFGGFAPIAMYGAARATMFADKAAEVAPGVPGTPGATPSATVPQTLGTNVQVADVDEPDLVKAVGDLVYDLDGDGNLRITDAKTLRVVSTLDVTPSATSGKAGGDAGRLGPEGPPRVSSILVRDERVAVFGSETEVSEPVEGDPSATRASTSYLTVTLVDAADPAAPKVTDRVRVEGDLVSARLVGGRVRLVTTANMADLGFVTPTTPTSVARALEMNRRSVAASSVADWIPDWQRAGGQPTPLVPCERVHVPDTFSGVAMTSMVTFPIGTGRFEPVATSILAPATTLYAGVDDVAVSSEVWVDPVDRDRLEFDDWRTAVHEFTFADGGAPSYEGSGIVDGSTVGQFAFGAIGGSLAVVTTRGTPWAQDPKLGVDLTVLTPDGEGGLAATSRIADLAPGKGAVTAVRFLDGRVLVSTGVFGREEVHVIDVTRPAAPRRAGRVALPGSVGYFHPLPDHRALVVSSRHDQVGEAPHQQDRSWVQASLLDVADPDAPRVLTTWERPWVADDLAADHHAFSWWPQRSLAMWGLHDTRGMPGDANPNHAVVLDAGTGLAEVALPEAGKPGAAPAPCPAVDVTDPEARAMVGAGGVVLRCGDRTATRVDWPRYVCSRVDAGMVARFAPGEKDRAAYFLCSPAGPPRVARVLVVSGTPILYTDQTMEALDPTTFRSTAVAYHPTVGGSGFIG